MSKFRSIEPFDAYLYERFENLYNYVKAPFLKWIIWDFNLTPQFWTFSKYFLALESLRLSVFILKSLLSNPFKLFFLEAANFQKLHPKE